MDGQAHAAEVRTLNTVAEDGRKLTERETVEEALAAIVRSLAAATHADIVVARVLLPNEGVLVPRAVASDSPALAAEVEGTRLRLIDLPEGDVDEPATVPPPLRRVAARSGAERVLQAPARLAGNVLGSVELLRRGGGFDERERLLARLAASQAGLAIAAFTGPLEARAAPPPGSAVALASEALAVFAANGEASAAIARLAVEAAGARAVALWVASDRGGPALAAAWGADDEAFAPSSEDVGRALERQEALTLERTPERTIAWLQVGKPPLGVLELRFAPNAEPGSAELRALGSFAVRAADALRSAERARRTTHELERSRALLAAVGQATAQLSVAHTLDAALEQVAQLLGHERVAVYLREQGQLVTAAERRLAGPHAEVAPKLLELALGRYRARGLLALTDAGAEPLLADTRPAVTEAGIEAVYAVPLVAREEVIGLLAVYPSRRHPLEEVDVELLQALAAQLAVAVQNARLHEEAQQLGQELEATLGAERVAVRRLRALNAISSSFVESMSLQTTLDVLARSMAELLDVDAVVVRMREQRGEAFTAQAIHVTDPAKAEALRAIFARPQEPSRAIARHVLRVGEPFVFDPRSAAEAGGAHALLVPFLERGSTAVLVPVAAAPGTVVATLMLLSLDSERRITAETIETALTVARQAAFAIDNARLHEQLNEFTKSMQDALLPSGTIDVEGLDLGSAYESSARLEVGGDLYDYVVLPDGRVAVVLGDVMGHGVDAAADMAMAKFVFRSLVREHSEPGEFLAHANDVVCGEVTPGKFVTLAYVTIDPRTGELACGCAGHPAPRLVRRDGSVEPVAASGLALGVEPAQTYEEARGALAPGSLCVLYTDGVVEARRAGELYGERRLDRFLAETRHLPAQEVARGVLADCRRFGRGQLDDDCAVVVLRRTAGD